MSNAPAPPGLTELLAGCLRGNRRSQELLYRQFYGYAMSICLRYTPTRDEAMEVLNDGFLKVFTRLDQFDLNQPFKPWLRRILINTALDQYRQAVQHYRQEDLSQAEQAAEPGADGFSQLAHEELIELIQLLSPAYRLVFNLYVMDGYSHEEIASQLGISVGASKSNLSRARENLKAMFLKKSQTGSRLTGSSQDKYARVIR
ncbi:sigma-70 family RNA polymerase sigma factor [Nibrella saemangeumensis]|uniref:Sigma-70 family RNA polymerase sigma factor n=1 Tax=Nibrella saemangeumensis TaxID=1084526 RepID=A0ABP8NPU2_9BACT